MNFVKSCDAVSGERLKSSTSNTSIHLHKLVCSILRKPKDDDRVSFHFRSALTLLSSTIVAKNEAGNRNLSSELAVVEKIKAKLTQHGRSDDIPAFLDLLSILYRSKLIRNGEAILILLLRLSQDPRSQQHIENCFVQPQLYSVSKPSLESTTTICLDKTAKKEEENSSILPLSNEVYSDADIIRELIFIFQGIEGRLMRFDLGEDRFKITASSSLSNSQVMMAERLAELGWMFRKVDEFCRQKALERNIGLIGQSLVNALKLELSEFYRFLTELESQYKLKKSCLTLHSLIVWTLEPIRRMKILCCIVDECHGLSGGVLLSTVYSFLRNGDISQSLTVHNLLSSMCRPIYTMVLRWICDGTLQDPYGEFFIASDPKIKISNRIWREKYSIRNDRIPNFISLEWAQKILATGKSINFLHEVCHDNSPIKDSGYIKGRLDETSPENLFMDSHNNLLHATIHRAYADTSAHLLGVLFGQYMFLEHLSGLRKYMLLSQGDVILYLLELLVEELTQPANCLYPHNLASILDTAIRSTNAQYEHPKILACLDVRLLDVESGDSGWNVFCLHYKVSGPFGTLLIDSTTNKYLRLFNALWKAKRIEWVMSRIWKTQSSVRKLSIIVPEIVQILHFADLLASEMIHFVHQMAYYVTFEAMECCWEQLNRDLKAAESFDQVIESHERYLTTLLRRSLLDPESSDLYAELRALYDRVLEYYEIQESLVKLVDAEFQQRRDFFSQQSALRRKGEFSCCDATDVSNQERQKAFIKKLAQVRVQLRLCAESYRELVQTFIMHLTCSLDQSLQFLSFRLDFNQFYKKQDSRIGVTRLNFQYRKSIMGSGTASTNSSFID